MVIGADSPTGKAAIKEREVTMESATGGRPRADYEPICVEPGSPMGEFLRRYWQPV